MSRKYFDPTSQGPVLGPGAVSLSHTTLFDDWLLGGYVKDEALSSESDPAGGKFSSVADASEWKVTFPAAAGTDELIAIQTDAPGGILGLTTDADDDDFIIAQCNGSYFKPTDSNPVYMETRFSVSDVDQADIFMGLAVIDGSMWTNVPDLVGGGLADGAGDLKVVTGKNMSGTPYAGGSGSTVTDTGTDLSDGTKTTNFVVLRMEVGGETVKFFVDGTLAATHTANIPDDVFLTPTMSIANGTTAATSLFVDYIFVSQGR